MAQGDRARRLRANAAADAAARDVGGGSADATTASCEMVRAGVFFDGTNNFRNRANDRTRSWHSNPDLLEEIYDETDGAVTTEVEGIERKVHFRKHYMRGIGVKANGEFSWTGPGLGTGFEGVDARVNQAIEQVRDDIRTQMQGKRPCNIWVDTFGFSRGATAARDFANEIRDGDMDSAGNVTERVRGRTRIVQRGPRPTVKFMGLFDTVSSTGWGGETDGTYWVDLTTPGRAETIYHITASDEFRANFPLTRALGGRNQPMIGAHGDIGGGYHPTHNSATFEYEPHAYPGVEGRIDRDWGARLNGPPGPGGERLRSEVRTFYPPAYGMFPPPPIEVTWHVFEWQATHGLQFVSLHLMHHHAVAKGVPFPRTLPDTIAGKSVTMDATLTGYFEALRDGVNLRPEALAAIRHTYCNFSCSHQDYFGLVKPFMPEADGSRDGATL